MGLDMYLSKIKRENVGYWRKANAIHKWFEDNCTENGEIENCRDYYVSKEKLIELKNTCERVIKSSPLVTGQIRNGERYDHEQGKFVPCYEMGKIMKDPSLAQELLPTQKGFFFGSTDYNEWYIEDLKETVEQIDEILKTTDFDECSIVYYAWW